MHLRRSYVLLLFYTDFTHCSLVSFLVFNKKMLAESMHRVLLYYFLFNDGFVLSSNE